MNTDELIMEVKTALRSVNAEQDIRDVSITEKPLRGKKTYTVKILVDNPRYLINIMFAKEMIDENQMTLDQVVGK